MFLRSSVGKLTLNIHSSRHDFTAQVQMLNIKTHTAITQRYTVTASELSKRIFKPVIHAAFNFIWKICMTRQQALLAFFF